MKLLTRLLLLTCFSVALTSGDVRFDVGNDAPTLTGAKITFTINIVSPPNKHLVPDGETRNFTIIGISEEGENTATSHHKDKNPPYVFVWKTWGKYWQVCDGPSSSLTIATDDVPLGSYVMDVVIYHYRKREKFIPMGYASTQFTVTDQIPFTVSLTQVNDKDEKDNKFIRNRAVAFGVSLHDPSQYLSQSDITFNWDFGDGSGTVISRELTVTHTYVTSGSFKPRVVIQAAIPDPSCAPKQPTEASPTDGSDTEELYETLTTEGWSSTLKISTDTEMMLEDFAEDFNAAPMKRQASETSDCVIYRFGSFSTEIEIMDGIENVQIIQVMEADGLLLAEMEQNSVDFTVICQGSPPTEVCTVVSDADCQVPVRTICSAVSPSPDCQIILTHSFNDSGIFCVNVSLNNDVSQAVTNTRVHINITAGSSLMSAGVIAIVLGILTVGSVLGSVAFAYWRLKGYQKLKESPALCQSNRAGMSSVPARFWSLLNQQTLGHKPGLV